MKITTFPIKAFIVLMPVLCSCGNRHADKAAYDSIEAVDTTQVMSVTDDADSWYSSVKGHYRPGSLENNETREMITDIWWNSKGGTCRVELVPALRPVDDEGHYADIHTNNLWESVYEEYGDWMWYFQIDSPYTVVEPLFLYYYFEPHFVYEGDLDHDGMPDFGILLTRQSVLCTYALLTIKDGHWALMTEPFEVAHNLRYSGKELARPGSKKGEIRITKSGFDDDGLSTFEDAGIVDTVVVAKRIDIGEFL